MKTFNLIHLESGAVVQTIKADSFEVRDTGVVEFFQNIKGPIVQGGGMLKGSVQPLYVTPGSDSTVAVTQASASILIVDVDSQAEGKVLPFVVPDKKE